MKSLDRKMSQLMAGMDHDFEMLMRQLLNINDPDSRGSLNNITEKSWF